MPAGQPAVGAADPANMYYRAGWGDMWGTSPWGNLMAVGCDPSPQLISQYAGHTSDQATFSITSEVQ